MKKARKKWLIKGRRENEVQDYHQTRKEAHKVIRNKKELLRVKSVIVSTEEDQSIITQGTCIKQ